MIQSELMFINFSINVEYVSADLILNGQYVMRISDHILHIENIDYTGVRLYDNFRDASLNYLDYRENL